MLWAFKNLHSHFQNADFSDGASANLHSFVQVGFKLWDNGTHHVIDKTIKSRFKKSSWFLFPKNTFTFLLVMGFRDHVSIKICFIFSLSGLERQLFSMLKCNITFCRNYFHHYSQSTWYQEPHLCLPVWKANGSILLSRDKLNWRKYKSRFLLSKCYLISVAKVKPTKRPCFK